MSSLSAASLASVHHYLLLWHALHTTYWKQLLGLAEPGTNFQLSLLVWASESRLLCASYAGTDLTG